jgi:hypothetical protein
VDVAGVDRNITWRELEQLREIQGSLVHLRIPIWTQEAGVIIAIRM